jgi:hypothetical protein
MATAIHCRHYDCKMPQIETVCALGVDLTAPGASVVAGCWNPRGGSCDKREPYTAEEIAAAEENHDAAMRRVFEIVPQIPANGNAGHFRCPACKTGMVYWARAASNGRVHANCTTDGCFRMMQ